MRKAHRQQGLSLVELLVSMAIALLVLLGVVQSFLSSRQALQFNEELGFIQENARFALDRLSRDLSLAGQIDTGDCPPIRKRHPGVADTTLEGVTGMAWSRGIPLPVRGHAPEAEPPAGIAELWPGSEVIQVFRTAGAELIRRRAHHHPSQSRFELAAGSHGARPGTVWTAVSEDCSQVAVFAQSGPSNGSGNATTVEHDVSAGSTAYNCTNQLNTDLGKSCFCSPPGGNGNVDGSAQCGGGLALGSHVWLTASASGEASKQFYLAPSSVAGDLPALYQRVAGRAEELVQGVEVLQAEYGLADGDRLRFVHAGQISDEADWRRVRVVRVQLVLRSARPILERAEPRTLLGREFNDRHLRQVASATIHLRNQLGEGGG